jgi:hypothetical protein
VAYECDRPVPVGLEAEERGHRQQVAHVQARRRGVKAAVHRQRARCCTLYQGITRRAPGQSDEARPARRCPTAKADVPRQCCHHAARLQMPHSIRGHDGVDPAASPGRPAAWSLCVCTGWADTATYRSLCISKCAQQSHMYMVERGAKKGAASTSSLDAVWRASGCTSNHTRAPTRKRRFDVLVSRRKRLVILGTRCRHRTRWA